MAKIPDKDAKCWLIYAEVNNSKVLKKNICQKIIPRTKTQYLKMQVKYKDLIWKHAKRAIKRF